ncbi:type II secretion system F family protein [Entomomonas asaccharolytica]|uniref:Type II secretion system F family protein n=1 Tax=Entomomonas asaccharolytica TaxID=2785331 RepID=A0A974NH06_9GAMM|nr:type II secretion system F family protein [Entomomonas asaccharolytica]QQP86425.1 type II secretion system F family protein [Entomomonas asaccharolytica]
MAQVAKTRTYLWKGVDKSGNKLKGELNATDPTVIKAILRKQGITAKQINRKLELNIGGKIKPIDIAIFTRQMATMMKAGVPMIQALEIIAEGAEKPKIRDLLDNIKQEVASGNSFTSSLRKRPLYFDELFCSLIEAGEKSGTLETLLDRVASYKEKSESLKKKVKKAMIYPAAILIVAVVVSAILLVKVVPQFAAIFQSFGADLPWLTQQVVDLSEYLQSDGWKVLIAIFVIGFVIKEGYKRSPAFRDLIDRGLLRIPIVGSIIYNSAVARFTRTLSTTFAAGVPLVEALDSVAGATGNIVYKKAVLKIKQEVSTGRQLNFAMRGSNVFPPLAIQLTAIGEESGSLDSMLGKAANFYEEAVDNIVDSLSALMEPMIMAVLGVIIGTLIIAMYLPIFQMGQVV